MIMCHKLILFTNLHRFYDQPWIFTWLRDLLVLKIQLKNYLYLKKEWCHIDNFFFLWKVIFTLCFLLILSFWLFYFFLVYFQFISNYLRKIWCWSSKIKDASIWSFVKISYQSFKEGGLSFTKKKKRRRRRKNLFILNKETYRKNLN